MKKTLMKENVGLSPDVVAARTLFVGIGGIGSTIVQQVAGMASEKCDPQGLRHMAFVCMDTNVNDLSELEKKGASIYTIQTSTTQTVGSYLDNDQDAFKNWFPNNSVMYAKTVSEGAGQVRAISRLALNASIKTGRIQPLFDAIDDLFRKEGEKFSQALRIAIVSSASGGTGSGMILPLSMLIRDYVNEKYPLRGVIVRAMLLLPETLDSVISSPVERESQRRNAYATMKEINAFMMKGSRFCEIGGDFDRYNRLHVDVPIAGTKSYKSLSSLPCDFCFLLDGQNTQDETLVSKEQYEEFAARALYEQHIGPMMKEAFGQDDNVIKEMSDPEKLGRNRFGGIGSGVIHYPYDAVVEYIAGKQALQAMGDGENSIGSWSQYDKKIEKERHDAERKGLPESEMPKLETDYTQYIDYGEDRFSVDLRQFYQLDSAEERIVSYLDSLQNEMIDSIENHDEILSAKMACPFKDGKGPDYAQPDKQTTIISDLDKLDTYNRRVNEYAKKVSSMRAKGIFQNDLSMSNASKKAFMLESILKSGSGKAMHPNAARYMLYKLLDIMERTLGSTKGDIETQEGIVKDSIAKVGKKYDVASTSEKEENSLREYAMANGDVKKNESASYYKKLNNYYRKYFTAIEEKSHLIAYQAALEEGCNQVRSLLTEYKRFFNSFDRKIEEIKKEQETLVASLQFKPGSSVQNVCCSKKILDVLFEKYGSTAEDGTMLSAELNADIYDRIKVNAAIAHEQSLTGLAVMDDAEENGYVFADKRRDVFDDTIIDFFIRELQNNCKSINMNVLEAIEKEKEILLQINKYKGKEENIPALTRKHISYMIEKGRLLAQPGCPDVHDDYPRQVRACAFNEELLELPHYELEKMLGDYKITPVDCKSVSRYELHFFISSYNLTLDKIPKFAYVDSDRLSSADDGLYFRAYTEWTRQLGPDSTKGSKISTHIDKRWDSIAEMPEIDFRYQSKRMKEVHRAMVNGLVFEKITSKKISPLSDKLRTYQYEDTDERNRELVVSNGTLCDEFYEILDALYINSSIVSDIEKMVSRIVDADGLAHANYEDTAFYKALRALQINDYAGEASSIFEIALNYYNSLPNSKRFNSEISLLIEAIVELIVDGANQFENEIDGRILACKELIEQFNLLMNHYDKSADLQANVKASENDVLDMIYRKIKTVLAGHDTVPRYEDYDVVVSEMKNRLK